MPNPFAYQHEKIGAAVRALMLPDAPFEKKLAGAMAEFTIAFHSGTPSDSARDHYRKITQIMKQEPHAERAKALTAMERSDVVKAFWELDRAVSRDYYTHEERR